eukprot:2829123-Pyramimonas_sp.AAC.1
MTRTEPSEQSNAIVRCSRASWREACKAESIGQTPGGGFSAERRPLRQTAQRQTPAHDSQRCPAGAAAAEGTKGTRAASE